MYEHVQTGADARRRLHVLLAAAGVEAAEVDKLVSAVEAGAEVDLRQGGVLSSRKDVCHLPSNLSF
ncbi:hypothetical protein ACN20G_00045 [Streptomyces sp. BI20]|uniref:hypothetical protein n=1 Tax=Streptomyces sp. BI20 TaxID=3403460 RepID=UPI003C72418E